MMTLLHLLRSRHIRGKGKERKGKYRLLSLSRFSLSPLLMRAGDLNADGSPRQSLGTDRHAHHAHPIGPDDRQPAAVERLAPVGLIRLQVLEIAVVQAEDAASGHGESQLVVGGG